jgi:acyl phosphate:glycerol-3-phosphate acyltransferase
MQFIIAIIIAYLLGAVPSAIIVCKFAKVSDPRTEGSKNPGTTNVLRIAGKKLAIITLAGDMLKGVVAVLVGRILHLQGSELGFIALAACIGHIYPIFLKFKGGRGVATAFGTMLALSFFLGLAVIATWVVIALVFRYSSLAAIVAAVLAPCYALLLFNPNYFLPLTIMTLLLLWRHSENIERLFKGTETKIGKK